MYDILLESTQESLPRRVMKGPQASNASGVFGLPYWGRYKGEGVPGLGCGATARSPEPSTFKPY